LPGPPARLRPLSRLLPLPLAAPPGLRPRPHPEGASGPPRSTGKSARAAPATSGRGRVMQTVTAAVVQMTSTAEVERNLTCAEALVRRAAERGARFVALPENFA